MKNKHLVLIFLAVLGVGMVFRKLPWRWREDVHATLLRLDTTQVTQLLWQAPGRPELLLERSEAGWTLTEGTRSQVIAPEQAAQWLAALQAVHSLKRMESKRPDTLGIGPTQGIRLVISQEKKPDEVCWLGREVSPVGQPATYFFLPNHHGIYLVAGRLRSLFDHTFDDFRQSQLLTFQPRTVRRLTLEWPDFEPFLLTKNDSTTRWATPDTLFSTSNDSVQTWLRQLLNLRNLPFADYFDESRVRETLHTRIILHSNGADSLVCSVFLLRPPDLPDDVSQVSARPYSPWVLHTSQNPLNYFALADTALARQICHGLLPPDNGIFPVEKIK